MDFDLNEEQTAIRDSAHDPAFVSRDHLHRDGFAA
jgi:hypothetical protein